MTTETSTFELKKYKRIRNIELINELPEKVRLRIILDKTSHITAKIELIEARNDENTTTEPNNKD